MELDRIDGLVEWLRAQLDDDEKVALAAAQTSKGGRPRYTRWDTSEWHGADEPSALVGQGTPSQPLALGHFIHSSIPRRHAEHIAHHDPARALAQVAAHRAILARHHAKDYPPWGVVCEGCGYEGPNDNPRYLIDECPELRDLASVYANRDGYREDWRPA